jgi:ABC-type nitrate/sulfonate/bicarbonate transport system substrate-binding protein
MTTLYDIEKPEPVIGFVPLTDCAPLVVAHEKGFFEAEGLHAVLVRERSWASIRDKTAYGVFDAAQMLYTMPLAMSLGVGGPAEATATAACLDLNGNAITVSSALFEAMRAADPAGTSGDAVTAAPLLRVIRARTASGLPPLTFGVVFPTSTHHYELRHWMQGGGIDPDRDVRVIVLPPPDMPTALQTGVIDGYCVGEPWNSVAIRRGWGRAVMTKYELWNNAPEKVLGVRRAWADRHPGTHLAMVRAVIAACAWCDEPANREEVAELIASPQYLDAPVEVVRMSILGTFSYGQDEPPRQLPDFNVFHRYAANFPWLSHAVWYLRQMIQAGQVDPLIDVEEVASRVLLPEVYRAAAASLGVATPTRNDKAEGVHKSPWTLTDATAPIEMGPDAFFDGGSFTLGGTRATSGV